MPIWATMTDRNGETFRQWRRSSVNEEPPDDGTVCVCCNARPVATPTGHLVLTHDWYMHAHWQTALDGHEVPGSVRPALVIQRDYEEDD